MTLAHGPAPLASAQVVGFLKAVDRRRDTLEPRLELQRQILGIVAGLVQVAAVEP